MTTRVVPAASVKIYDPGAETWCLDNGFDCYDLPAKQFAGDRDPTGQSLKEWSYAVSYRTLFGIKDEPAVVAIPEIGLVTPAPRTVFRDIDLSHWNLSVNGLWEARLTYDPDPDANGERHLRMVQDLLTPDDITRAESLFSLPTNPNLAMTVQRLEPSHAQTNANGESGIDIVLSDAYLIHFGESASAGLWWKRGGRWQQAHKLSLPAKEETRVWVMVRRGCVGFSFDAGEKWSWIRDAVPLSIPAGGVVVEATGCMFNFGFHELAADKCQFDSYELALLEDHLGTPILDLSQSLRPTGTQILCSLLSSSPATLKYRCLMVPKSFPVVGLAFDLWRFPEVYGLRFVWPVLLTGPTSATFTELTTAEPGDLKIEVSEDADLTQRTGSITYYHDPRTTFSGQFGYLLTAIQLGYLMSDGAFSLFPRCLMYLLVPEPSGKSWEGEVRFSLADLWHRAQSTLVDESWGPLDGFSCLAARNYILLKMGLNWATRADWLNTGAVLSSGLPDRARWQPQVGQTAADLIKALDVWENTESFVAADGTWTSRPARFVDGFTSYVFSGDPATDAADPDFRLLDAKNRQDNEQRKTATFVQGTDLQGGHPRVFLADYNLERNPAAAGFVGWRKEQRFDSEPLVTLLQCLVIAAQRQARQAANPQLPELTVPGCPNLYRGMRIQVTHAEYLGMSSSSTYRVERPSFTWAPGKRSETTTRIGVRQMT